MNELLKRNIKLGDFVFYYTGKKYVDSGEYAIVVGNDKVFNEEYGLVTCNHVYLIETPTLEQKSILEKYKIAYNKFSLNVISGNVLENKIGSFYIQESQNIFYMYLGKYNVIQRGISEIPKEDILIMNKENPSGYCYIRFNCATEGAKQALLKSINQYKNINSVDELNEFLNDAFGITRKLVNRDRAGRWKQSIRVTPIKLDTLLISTKQKKFSTELFKININIDMSNFIFKAIPSNYSNNINWKNYVLNFKSIN